MNKTINTFSTGMNQDLSVNKYPNTSFFDAQNFRLVSKDSLGNAALNNIKGTVPKISLPGVYDILGYCLIRDTLILFIASENGGKIYKWDYNSTDYEESPTLIYEDPDLNFQVDVPIRAVGRYENEDIQKVYFTDGQSFFKFLNIASDSYPIDNTVVTVESLDLVADIDFKLPSLTVGNGGSVPVGRISYAYQLYNAYGSESSISPTSYSVHITASEENGPSTVNYTGSDIGDDSNKSIQVNILNTGNEFSRIKLYAIEYVTITQVPNIRIVGEYIIYPEKNISILDTGQSVGELTLEEFRFIQNEFWPQSLDIKDDYLFAANIIDNYFDITDDEFDARAFRGDNLGIVGVKDGNTTNLIDWHLGWTTENGLPDITHECYNSYNNINHDYIGTLTNVTGIRVAPTGGLEGYKYKPSTGLTYGDGTKVLGGEGTYISYEFVTSKVLIDNAGRDFSYLGKYPRLRVGIEGTDWTNYANPNLHRGYQRDEVYRFGIVFYDLKGRQSFTKWIGDIKFPTNEDLPFVEYEDGSDPNYNQGTYANILGIQFKVELPDAVKDKISGYQIVRAERTSNDRTIYAQGIPSGLIDRGTIGYEHPESNSDKYHKYHAPVPFTPYEHDWDNAVISMDRHTMDDTTYPGGPDGDVISEDGYYLDSAVHDKDPGTPQSQWINMKYIDFTSPEFCVNRNTPTASDAFIEVIGYQDQLIRTAIKGPTEDADGNSLAERYHEIFVNHKYRGFTSWRKHKTNIESAHLVQPKATANSTEDPNGDGSILRMTDGDIINNQVNNRNSNVNKNPGQDNSHMKRAIMGTHLLCVMADDHDSKFLSPQESDFKGTKSTNKYYAAGELDDNPALADNRVIFANYRIDRGKSQYGGTDYNARTNTTYYAASSFVDKGTDTVNVYNGDTFITFFTHIRGLFDNEKFVTGGDTGDSLQAVISFPVETSINLSLRSDPYQDYMNWGNPVDSLVPDYTLQETVSEGVRRYGGQYPVNVGDLYRYNSAYSAMDKSKEFYPKPLDFEVVQEYDVRITASDKKINGEYIDNWTKFRFNNILDVDSAKHPITRILTFKNNLFYFQPLGVGVAAVNQRSLIQDGNAGELSLGSGDILQRYDYITEQSGTEKYDGIVASDTTLFYVDNRRKRINKISSGKELSLSITKGIDSLLDSLDFDTVVAGFDKGFNEVIFSIDNKTIAFSELTDSFFGTYTYTPKLFIPIANELFSIASRSDENPWMANIIDKVGYIGETDADAEWDYIVLSDGDFSNTLWKHNTGDRGSFYGSGSAEDSYITLIINPNGNIVNSFDNLDLRTDSVSIAGVDQVTDTFYELDATNGYQDITRTLNFTTGNVSDKGNTYNDGSIKRIARIWRTPIIQNQTSGASYKRLVDTYLKVTLRYDNSSNNSFRVHDVITYFRPTRR